uniref:Secreted protein n=1 Tax=Heterorhabditis bacteriophora TaxID=37862 RepID=A0A1I7W9X0_HETBA
MYRRCTHLVSLVFLAITRRHCSARGPERFARSLLLNRSPAFEKRRSEDTLLRGWKILEMRLPEICRILIGFYTDSRYNQMITSICLFLNSAAESVEIIFTGLSLSLSSINFPGLNSNFEIKSIRLNDISSKSKLEVTSDGIEK